MPFMKSTTGVCVVRRFKRVSSVFTRGGIVEDGDGGRLRRFFREFLFLPLEGNIRLARVAFRVRRHHLLDPVRSRRVESRRRAVVVVAVVVQGQGRDRGAVRATATRRERASAEENPRPIRLRGERFRSRGGVGRAARRRRARGDDRGARGRGGAHDERWRRAPGLRAVAARGGVRRGVERTRCQFFVTRRGWAAAELPRRMNESFCSSHRRALQGAR